MKKNTTMVTMTMVTAIMVGMLTGCKAYQKVEADQVQPTMEVEEISTKTPEEIAEARRIAREYNEEVQRKAKEKAEEEAKIQAAREYSKAYNEEVNSRPHTPIGEDMNTIAKKNSNSSKNATTSQQTVATQPTKTETVVQPTNNQPTQNVAQPTQTETPQPTVVEQPTQPAPQPEVQQPAPQPQPEPQPEYRPTVEELTAWFGTDDFVEVTDTSHWRADSED